MNLSRHSVEMLIDLVENKLSCFEVFDRDDKREQMLLERPPGLGPERASINRGGR